MSRKLLILGNGVSRKNHTDFINEWEEEIWACNFAFKELSTGGLKRIDAMTGDRVALLEAIDYKQKTNSSFTIWSRHEHNNKIDGVEPIHLSDEYVYDSGTSLVCKALLDNYDEIFLIGFDLGGADLYVEQHHTRNKSSWIIRWRFIAEKLGLERITFVGTDHKSFILSNKPADMYAKIYMNGQNHLDHDYDSVIIPTNDVVILGNGKSRADYHEFVQNWKKELWVCNEAYVEPVTKQYKVTRVCSVHPQMICEAFDFKNLHKLSYKLFSSFPVEGVPDVNLFTERKGWSTGSLCVMQAILEKFQTIYLLGFDFGGPDLYKDYNVTGSNFKKQFIEIKRTFPHEFKSKIKFMGPEPNFLYGDE